MSNKIRLKVLREDNEITQEKLAEELFVSQDAISDWERGRRYPSHKNGIKLVELFNAPSLEWLMATDEPASSA